MGDERRIGILCQTSKPVFSEVARRLRNGGFQVRFFHPRSDFSPDHVADLSMIVNKKTLPSAFHALRHARRTGTALWNNLQATVLFSSRLVGLQALSEVGFLTPEVTFEKPDGEYVAKGCYIWNDEPELNGEGDFYQELIPTEPVDYKYYAVHDGSQTHVAGRRVTSKLYGEKQFLGQIQIEPALAASLRELVDRFDLRGVGVDLVEDDDGEYWAVDVNLAAGYRDTGLEPALTESIVAGLPGE
jgi:glutathione synthase/RimK-type ligase-like ATP-grasp enzyme